MENEASTARIGLEQLLADETAEPKALQLSLLKDITGGFSDEREIGRGGFAVVYKGIIGHRAVAVKRLLPNACMDEKQFHQEVECLMRVSHKNVVRFLGYCADTQGSVERYNGKFVVADVQQRLFCFEYIPKGSLAEYINDTHREWGTCYKIIKGICDGLQYLHENNIIHLDLKPANILLDDSMVPKITDFGLSRCFDENQSQDITKTFLGTIGYMAPEVRFRGEITRNADLYSLGVIIIEILTGQKGYQDIEDVLESWSDRLEMSQGDTPREQIRLCYEMALECMQFIPKKRPASAWKIIDRLHEMEHILTAGVASPTTSGSSVEAETEFKGMSNIDDPRVFCFIPTRGRASSEAEGPRPTLPMKAEEAFEKAWPWEEHLLSQESLTDYARYNVYYSPKLMYLKIAVIAAKDLVSAEEGRSLAPTTAKIQLGAQIRRTRQKGSANPVWREEFMFNVSEPLEDEDPLVVTVEEHVGPGRDEPIGRLIIPVNSPYVPRNDFAKSVPPKWFALWPGVMETSASKIHLMMSLETRYHVFDELTEYASDLQPSCYVRS